jgi:hypothetical protein
VYIWSDEWQGESGEEEEMAECIGVPASKSFVSHLPFQFIISLPKIREIRNQRFTLGT